MLVTLVILTFILFLLTLYSIIQTNAEVFHLKNSHFVSLKLLDINSAASLFITLVGALLVRHQFALGVTPRINYRSKKTERHNRQNRDEVFDTWRVEIHNTGLGSAIINEAEYVFQSTDAKDQARSFTFESIIKRLAEVDLIPERDYWIQNMSSGFSLAAKDDFLVFEIKMECVEKIKSLEIALYFQSQLGNRYCRKINLLPRLDYLDQ